MKKIHLNFAHNSHKHAQQLNKDSAINVGGFDISYSFSLDDLDKKFFEENKNILTHPRGAGYWLWKPYFILKVLNECDLDDVVFYTDSGSVFIDKIDPVLNILNIQDVVPFEVDGALEIHNTKRDCFLIMGCDDKNYHYSTHANAAFILTKKSDLSVKFFTEYLKYSCDEKCITDNPSILLTEHLENKGHRHDQSIFSLLSKKYNLTQYRDPSQWGNSLTKNKELYNQIVSHTRYNG